MAKSKEAIKIAFFIAMFLAVPVWAVLFSDGSGPAENYYRGAEF